MLFYGSSAAEELVVVRLEGSGPETIRWAGWSDDLTYTQTLTASAWYKLDCVYDGTSASIYLNGALVLGPTAVSWNTVLSGTMDVGSWAGSDPFYGKLDEVRVSSVVRNADWIAHEYVQQSGLSPWYTVGSWTLPSGDYSCAGPSSGYALQVSTSFTCTRTSGAWSVGNTVTIGDGSQGGTITSGGNSAQNSLTVTPGVLSSFTYTYTPAAAANISLSYSNNYSGSDPSSTSYISNARVLSLSGCTSGNLRVASNTCTLASTGGTFSASVPVVLSDGGNLGTFTSGSSGNPLTVTLSSGSPPFTFTYTPYLVGKKPITATPSGSWSTSRRSLYASSSADVCTFTAKANGNWASASTWTPSGCTGGGHTTPDSGDSVVVPSYHVTIPVSTTAYMGSCPANNTTYDLQISTNGTTSGILEIAGTLWLCGNRELIASGSYGDNPTAWPILQIGHRRRA